MLDLLYLTFNLLKSGNSLKYTEVLVASTSLDTINAALSMAFSDKDVLAARALVVLCFLGQLFALAAEGLALHQLRRFEPSQRCAYQPRHPLLETSAPLSWTYFAVRCLVTIAPAPIVVHRSARLNVMKHAYQSLEPVHGIPIHTTI